MSRRRPRSNIAMMGLRKRPARNVIPSRRTTCQSAPFSWFHSRTHNTTHVSSSIQHPVTRVPTCRCTYPQFQLHSGIRDIVSDMKERKNRIKKSGNHHLRSRLTGRLLPSFNKACELSPLCGIPTNRPPPFALGPPPSGLLPGIVCCRSGVSIGLGTGC